MWGNCHNNFIYFLFVKLLSGAVLVGQCAVPTHIFGVAMTSPIRLKLCIQYAGHCRSVSAQTRKCHHFDDIFTTGYTEGFISGYFLCRQCWKFRQNDVLCVHYRSQPIQQSISFHMFCMRHIWLNNKVIVTTSFWRNIDVIITSCVNCHFDVMCYFILINIIFCSIKSRWLDQKTMLVLNIQYQIYVKIEMSLDSFTEELANIIEIPLQHPTTENKNMNLLHKYLITFKKKINKSTLISENVWISHIGKWFYHIEESGWKSYLAFHTILWVVLVNCYHYHRCFANRGSLSVRSTDRTLLPSTQSLWSFGLYL